MDARKNNNIQTCAICLEPLASGDKIGTIVPCGHCFHEKCWNRWKAASRTTLIDSSGRSCNPKCPMCNTVSTTFCRLFLDLNNGAMQEKGKPTKGHLASKCKSRVFIVQINKEGSKQRYRFKELNPLATSGEKLMLAE